MWQGALQQYVLVFDRPIEGIRLPVTILPCLLWLGYRHQPELLQRSFYSTSSIIWASVVGKYSVLTDFTFVPLTTL